MATALICERFRPFGVLGYLYHELVRGIRWISFLDYVEYNKTEAVAVLQERFGYKPYPYKHYESVFTRFYQGYILPTKFGIDKRRVHLSTLVLTRQMDRAEALADLEKKPYSSEDALQQDLGYFLKKMGWTKEQLDAYLKRPGKAHDSYASELPLWRFVGGVGRKLGALKRTAR